MTPHSKWTESDFQQAIARLRLSAHNRRKLADKEDAEADEIRKELAAKQTMELFRSNQE
jgi:hypothetical protein